MAQSALTVTPPNPTPPTNFSSVGATPPNPPNYTRQSYAGAFAAPPTNPPPFFDDGSAASGIVFAANTAALASGTSAADNNTGTTPGTVATAAGGTGFNSVLGTYPVAGGLVPASSSVAHEGAGSEVAVTQTYSAAVLHPIDLVTVSAGPAIAADAVGGRTINANANHASYLGALTPTITGSPAPNNVASGVGTVAITLTGTNYRRDSLVYIDGILQNSNYVSATSITVANAPKRSTAGTRSVTVVNGVGGVPSSASTWTFT